MAEQAPTVGMERKLTAIFSTDVAGYSRLMRDDEEATIRSLTTYRALIASLIHHHQYRGRVVDAPGDNLLAEFASIVDAVRCAVEIQHALKTKNAELPDHRQMQFRIGINLGDVIVEGERLYGDGVNIAARLESLAPPGGICISGTVYDHVKNKLSLNYEDLGEQAVKNIAEPVRVYRVAMDDAAAALAEQGLLRHAQYEQTQTSTALSPSPSSGQALSKGIHPKHRGVLLLTMLILLVGAALGLRYFSPLLSSPQAALPLPNKPSIVVLPFANMSNDPEQDYFSDGMTDTLITDLSKLSGLFVIARNSAFTYKGKAVKVEQMGQELGVRYVLEGSVQKAQTRVRINVQLVDATTGQHLWAERYDQELKDIFTLQDELTRRIVGALQVKLTAGEQGRIGRVPTENLEAYDYYLRGLVYRQRFTQDAMVQARQWFEKAIVLDPQFALAYSALSLTFLVDWSWGWSTAPHTLDQGVELAEKARALDDALPEAHAVLGLAYKSKGQPEQGLVESERAIALDPNCAPCHIYLAEVLLLAGQPEEALGLIEKAMRLDPESAAYYSRDLGWAYRSMGRYEEALTALKRALTRHPDYLPAHFELARLYNELNREEEARAAEAEVRRLYPNVPLDLLREKPAVTKPKAVPKGFFARSSDRLKAVGYLFSGNGYFYRFTPEGNAQAQQLWQRATELDPQFALAQTALGITYLLEWAFQWSNDPQTLERALALARRAIAVDDASPAAHQLLGTVYLAKNQPDRAIVEAERAIALDPHDAEGYRVLGSAYTQAGQPEDGIGVLEKGLRLKPRFPASLFSILGEAYYLAGRYEDALVAEKQALSHAPNWLSAHLGLVLIYSALGREEEAQAEVGEIRRLSPKFSVEGVRPMLAFTDPKEAERILAALRKAGLK